MPLYAFEFLQRQYITGMRGKKVLLLGVSYLNDVGDTRYSPVEAFYDQFLHHESIVSLHDPHVFYWEEKNVRIEQDLNESLAAEYDIIVISTGHKEYRTDVFVNRLLSKEPTFIYDTIGVFTNDNIRQLRTRHTVKILGRGDL